MTTEQVLNKFTWPAPMCEHWNQIEAAMKEYARIKCLEAIKNTKEAACFKCRQNIAIMALSHIVPNTIEEIQNIPNQDVMPEL